MHFTLFSVHADLLRIVLPAAERKKLVDELTAKMKEAAKKLEIEEAARLRDEIAKIRKL